MKYEQEKDEALEKQEGQEKKEAVVEPETRYDVGQHVKCKVVVASSKKDSERIRWPVYTTALPGGV